MEPTEQNNLPTEFDQTLPLDTSLFRKITRKHHRLLLFASILKRRYVNFAIMIGIVICLVGELLLLQHLVDLKKQADKVVIPKKIKNQKVLPPAKGMYIGAFPDFGDSEDNVNSISIEQFDMLASKPMYWIYFSNNWYNGISFPKQEVSIIRKNGSIPYIRLMPRSMLYETSTEPILTLQRIAKGDFDVFIEQWAKDAKTFASPLIVEFGPEVNGNWEPWNATFAGGQKDGPKRFIAAYRHIIDLFRKEGVANVTWVYHITIPSDPNTPWNSYTSYYPGDDYIDWIGLSVYGAISTSDTWQSFSEKMDGAYPQLTKNFPKKPFAIVELGIVDNPEKGDKAQWINDALKQLSSNKYPQVKAVSYWNAIWQDQNGNEANTSIDSSPQVLAAFRKYVTSDFFIGGLGKVTSNEANINSKNGSVDQTIAQTESTKPGISEILPQSAFSSLIGKPWQWQLSGTIDTAVPAQLFDVDGENTDAATVAKLHKQGAKVICYINAGMWEPGRSDSNAFPDSILGSQVAENSDNKWLDINNLDVLAPIMQKRLDMCKQKGFDGVDPDSIDAYARDTGFTIDPQTQLAYNRWLAEEAHKRGLTIGLHNDNDQVHDLLGYFDFAIADACINQNRCDDFAQFILFGKPVFDAEYTDYGTTTSVCAKANTMQLSTIIKNSQLDSTVHSCN